MRRWEDMQFITGALLGIGWAIGVLLAREPRETARLVGDLWNYSTGRRP